MPFPGLLGRGLIEGARLSVVRAKGGALSPVYWAGASLKVRLVARRPQPKLHFPRSTGPGPH